MIEKTVYLPTFDSVTFDLGRVNENNYIRYNIRCDSVFEEHPNANVVLMIKPPGGEVYEGTVTVSGNSVLWPITATDTATDGKGQIQLIFTDGTEIIKTAIANTTIAPSLIA